MHHLLLSALKEKECAEGKLLPPPELEEYTLRYLAILDEGDAINPPAQFTGHHGRVKQSDAVNLLRRLRQYKDDVLRLLMIPRCLLPIIKLNVLFGCPSLSKKFPELYDQYKGLRFFAPSVLTSLPQDNTAKT